MSNRRRLAVSLVAAAAAAGAVPLFVGSGSSGAAPAPAQCPSTPSYDYTIPTPVGPPAAVTLSSDDTAETGYAALGADRKLYYVEGIIDPDPSDTQVDVTPLACLGGQATDAPAVALGADGTRAFFVRTSTGALYQRYVTTNYSSLGRFTKVNNAATTAAPAALQTSDGQYHLFVRGTNGALYHGYRQTVSATSWRFEKLGGAILGAPAAVVDGTSVLVAVVGTNGAVYTVRGHNGAWSGFARLTNPLSGSTAQLTTRTTPAVVADPDTGAVTVYAVRSSQGLYAISKAANASFTGELWDEIDNVLPSDARIAAATNGADSVVFARFRDPDPSSGGQYVTAFTQYVAADEAWSDYFLAPYTCFDCAPFGVDTSAVGKAAAKSAKARLSPGKGSMGHSRTTVVIKHK